MDNWFQWFTANKSWILSGVGITVCTIIGTAIRLSFKRIKAINLKKESRLKFEDNMCWAAKGDGTKDGPFCAVCYDKDQKRIHLHHNGEFYYCPICHFTEEMPLPIVRSN